MQCSKSRSKVGTCFVNEEQFLRRIAGYSFAVMLLVICLSFALRYKEEYNVELEIKKPNDIVYHNKKIGGILTETILVSEQVKYLVVGIGINTVKMQFTDDIKDIATSIKKEFEVEVEAQEFISKFCNKFEKYILERIEK